MVGSSSAAYLYLHEYQLPLILTMAQQGDYRRAMDSTPSMRAFADHLAEMIDRNMNMDF